MPEFASLPLFTDAYLADAGHLSFEEHGRYLLLLIHMWRSPGCRLPDDDAWLARKFNTTEIIIKNTMRPLVVEFMSTHDGWITQKRLQKEWEWCQAKRNKNKKAAETKWALKNNEKEPCERMASNDGSGNAPTPSPSPTYIEEAKASSIGARKRATRLPDNWGPSTNEWEYARAKGLSIDRIATEAEKFRNYWTAKSGKDATKINWGATWQNWILNTVERNGVSGGRGNGQIRGSLTDRALALASQAHERELSSSVGTTTQSFGGSGDSGPPYQLLPQRGS